MTGRADAVSQQFTHRTNTIIEDVMAHTRNCRTQEFLGLTLP
jgi:hypothetical protein